MIVSHGQFRALCRLGLELKEPVLGFGSPGQGKTQGAKAAAAEYCEAMGGGDVEIVVTATSDPTDWKGLPFAAPEKEVATWLPFGLLSRMITATRPLVVVLDDLAQGSAMVMAAVQHLVLERQAGEHRLSPHVRFLMTANRRRDNAGSGRVPTTLIHRAYVVTVETGAVEWDEWARGAGVDPMVRGFLAYRPERLCAFDPAMDEGNSPTPRNWERAARAYARLAGNGRTLLPIALAAAVGDGAGAEFLAFEAMSAALVTVEDVQRDPHGAPIPGKMGESYALTGALARVADGDNWGAIAAYMGRLLAHPTAREFAVRLWRDSTHRVPALASHPASSPLLVGPLGRVLVGG